MGVTIWHNPSCSNSRGALTLIRDAGFEPTIVDYLADAPDETALREVLHTAGLRARELVRDKEPLFAELELADADDGALVAAMATHPRLINRPVVITGKGTRLCRPPERVLEIL